MNTLFSSQINKAAWIIRKAAAQDLGISVKDISWKTCLEMARKGEQYIVQLNDISKEVSNKREERKFLWCYPEDKIHQKIWDEFRGSYNLDNIIVTPHDIEMNSTEKRMYSFHINPNNWSGDTMDLISFWVKLTETGKVKKRSLRINKWAN